MKTYIYAILFVLTAFNTNAQSSTSQKATAVWVKDGCNYSILEYDGWFHVAEKINTKNRLSKGDIVHGTVYGQRILNYSNLITNEKLQLKVDKRYKTKLKALDDIAARKKCTISKEDYAQ